MTSLNPPNRTRQISGQHSSQGDRLKAKQQCESGMRRSDLGNFLQLTKTLSRVQATSALTRPAVRTSCAHSSPQVHSYRPSSWHPPSMTLLRVWATVVHRHQPHQQSSLPQRDAHSHEPQGDPYLFFFLTLQLILAYWNSMKM